MKILLLAVILSLSCSAQTAWLVYDSAGALVLNPAGGSVFALKSNANTVVHCGFSVVEVDLSVDPATRLILQLECKLPMAAGGPSASIPPTGAADPATPVAGQVIISGDVQISGDAGISAPFLGTFVKSSSKTVVCGGEDAERQFNATKAGPSGGWHCYMDNLYDQITQGSKI